MEPALLSWFEEHCRDLPWRRTRDPYAILVSEVMLQQTQVERVVPRYREWLGRWPTADALAAAPLAEVIRAWQGLGYNRRAVSLHRAARQIADRGWPDDLSELPGVGPYTAAAVSNFALGRPVLPVDTNVARVQERTGATFSHRSGQALMDLGATICLARIPRCEICPLALGCPSRGRRYEPQRKQSRFEGSFRQRRASTLRLVAAGPRNLSELDAGAVAALERDGLVHPRGELVTLPEASAVAEPIRQPAVRDPVARRLMQPEAERRPASQEKQNRQPEAVVAIRKRRVKGRARSLVEGEKRQNGEDRKAHGGGPGRP